MKDHERLDLLKEIGGTRVYEERRKESLKIMVDTGKHYIFLEQSFRSEKVKMWLPEIDNYCVLGDQ